MAAFNIIEGDCLTTLPTLPERHFHACVTSPPYFNLRFYIRTGDPRKPFEVGTEKSPAAYVQKMVDVARGVRRVLRDDGTFWLNVGDSYSAHGSKGAGKELAYQPDVMDRKARVTEGILPKSLCLIPFRLAIALQEDGWYVRSVIRWFKVSPMPEPVRDRPTSAVEEIFLLTKSPTYYYDQCAELVPSARAGDVQKLGGRKGMDYEPDADDPNYRNGYEQMGRMVETPTARNLWNWWELAEEGSGSWFVPNEGLKANHYAAFPSEIPRRCISLGTSAHGCCADCGEPYRRVVTREKATRYRPNDLTKRTREEGTGNAVGNTVAGVTTETTGWEAGCGCNAGEPIPCRVLDPFCGAATTILAAIRMGRHATGLELNPEYVRLGTRRLVQDNPLFNAQEAAPPMTTDACTAPEKILLTAAALEASGASPFAASTLVVEAWRLHPTTFGLAGYAEAHPDANRVLAGLMGKKGLVARKHLDRTAAKMYALTAEGREVVRRLRGEEALPPPAPKRPAKTAKLTMYLDATLQDLLARVPAGYGDSRREVTFSDACRFWGISSDAASEKVVGEHLDSAALSIAELARFTAGGDVVLRDGRCVSAADAERLREVDAWLRERFRRHLALLVSRKGRVA